MNGKRPVLGHAVRAAIPLALWVLAPVGPADALNFTLGPDAGVDCDVSLTYGAGWRTKGQDDKLIADVNGDDGDRNFDRWSFVNNRLSAVVDLDLHYKKFGFFLRPRGYYDFAYQGKNDNDSPATNNNGPANGGPNSDNDEFTRETKDRHGQKAEILDAFAYGKANVAGIDVVARAGRQVVSWGESLFLLGGISSAQSPLDATAANVPGVELKDIFLPVGQGFVQLGKWEGLSLAGYYQWEWDKTKLDESGAFFNTQDPIDDAGNHILARTPFGMVTLDRGNDKHPKDSGQWGVAVRYLAEGLNNTEFGAYFLNYHEKTPMLVGKAGTGTADSMNRLHTAPGGPTLAQARGALTAGIAQIDAGIAQLTAALAGDPTNAALLAQLAALQTQRAALAPQLAGLNQLNYADTFGYHLEYAEDVKLFGMSVSTVLFGANVAGEFSYRDGLPVKVNDSNPANLLKWKYKKANVLQAQASGIYLFGSSFLWDNLTFTGEVGFNKVNGISSDDFYTDETGYPFKSNNEFAWGYVAKFAFDYNQVLSGLDLQVPITYKGNPKGISSVPGTFAEGQDSLGVSFDFTYQSVYKLGVGYTTYLNGHDKNPKADRDFFSLNLKYTF